MTYEEAAHPRGTAGRWTEKDHSEPALDLGAGRDSCGTAHMGGMENLTPAELHAAATDPTSTPEARDAAAREAIKRELRLANGWHEGQIDSVEELMKEADLLREKVAAFGPLEHPEEAEEFGDFLAQELIDTYNDRQEAYYLGQYHAGNLGTSEPKVEDQRLAYEPEDPKHPDWLDSKVA